MEFFNKKEEVIDFQLNEYGKYLLSLGRMRPVYYSFYDEEILYDNQAGGASGSEVQKDIDRRIRFETPSFKPPSSTRGAETRVGEWIVEVEAGLNPGGVPVLNNSAEFVNAFDLPPPYPDINNFTSTPLGTSELLSEYAPAWHIEFASNFLTSSAAYVTTDINGVSSSNGIVREIPQLNVTLDYSTYYQTDPIDENIIELVNTNGLVPLYLAVNDNYLTIEIDEVNTGYEKENFEIEVYEDQSATGQGLVQLTFLKAGEGLPGPPGSNEAIVENYMNIFMDDEIPENIIKDLDLKDKNLSLSARRLRLSRDLYHTVNEEPCPDPASTT